MTLLFSLISCDTTVLAKYASSIGNFSSVVEKVLSSHPALKKETRTKEEDRRSFTLDSEHLLHFRRSNSFIFIVITQTGEDTRIKAFQFLEEIKRKFYTFYNENDLKNALPLSINSEFSQVLHSEMKRYKDDTGEEEDKIQKIVSEVDQVRTIAANNIESIIERGERLELLVDKTEHLSSAAISFKQTSREVSRKLWWGNVKWMVLIAICVIGIIYGILACACGGPGIPQCRP